jgi:hypothetical protein
MDINITERSAPPRFNAIPELKSPYSTPPKQPADIRLAPMDDTHVVLTRRQIAGLLEYSTTLPSGVYPGKVWKAIDASGTILLRWYGVCPEAPDTHCTNNQRIVLIGRSKT